MPILKKDEPIPKRPVIIVLYGEPGIGKTSLFNTSNEPLLIDFDRGSDRAILRQDTLIVRSWEDVIAEEKNNTFSKYKTIGIDTAKSALDDFLMAYVVRKDIKNQKNKQAAYGSMGEEFKLFVNQRRIENGDIVIIAHAKNEKNDGDLNRKIPDVTGGSYQLLLRIADQVGYVSTTNNRRTIQFEPSDGTIGKNVARLPLIEIPDVTDPKFHDFMGMLIEKVKDSICALSEAQQEAINKAEKYQKEITDVKTADDINLLITPITALPKAQKDALLKLVGEKAKSLELVWDKEAQLFKAPEKPAAENKNGQQRGKKAELNF